MSNVVLIPGGFNGAWVWEDVVKGLENSGHLVHSLTLPGLEADTVRGEGRLPNLDDHIDHVVSYIAKNDLDDLIVCAHSYGGMVLRGVCDAIPERCRGAIFVDAFLPDEGQSCWMLLTEQIRFGFTILVTSDGRYIAPPPRSDPRSVSHPVTSLMQASRAGKINDSIKHAYIYATAWNGSPFTSVYERLQSDERWETYEIAESHEIMRHNSPLLAEMLDKTIVNWA
ncbi:alpha/beta fold hydrolase [Nocardia sp. NPDC046473]|uniref:alpha/beta hydrolase n=1 Tax=Nocardia sp. NPDC046473 TaxID=3155733 RepID=UPI0033E75A6D